MVMESRFSELALRAMARTSGDYVSKDVDELEVVADLKKRYGLETVYRFDIGKNTDGFSPLISDVFEVSELIHLMAGTLQEYPENHYVLLRRQLAKKHGISEDSFVFGAGLESVIDQISRAVLNLGDKALIPTPNFDVFESSTVRAGGDVEALRVDEHGLLWTEATVERMERRIARGDIKLVWISNPVNPTGQCLPMEFIERLAHATRSADTFLVVDEAYGEYCDRDDEVVSATGLIGDHPQLMVLRTFSKIYCLPSARVGYMACSDRALHEAVLTFRPMFPFSWISLYMAQLAVLDHEHVVQTRCNVQERKRLVEAAVADPGAKLTDFEFVITDTNTIMFRHKRMTADALHEALARQGYLTANLNNVTGIQGQQYLRMTLHEASINEGFLRACSRVVAA